MKLRRVRQRWISLRSILSSLLIFAFVLGLYPWGVPPVQAQPIPTAPHIDDLTVTPQSLQVQKGADDRLVLIWEVPVQTAFVNLFSPVGTVTKINNIRGFKIQKGAGQLTELYEMSGLNERGIFRYGDVSISLTPNLFTRNFDIDARIRSGEPIFFRYTGEKNSYTAITDSALVGVQAANARDKLGPIITTRKVPLRANEIPWLTQENIDGYIKNKTKPYDGVQANERGLKFPRDGRPNPGQTNDQAISDFKAFLNQLGTADSHPQKAMITFINTDSRDPFGFGEGLDTAKLSRLRSEVSGYNGTMESFEKRRLEIIQEINEFVNAFSAEENCATIALKIKESRALSDVFSDPWVRGSMIIAGAAIAVLSGGTLAPVSVAAFGLAGGAYGSMINSLGQGIGADKIRGWINTADPKIIEMYRKSIEVQYKLSYTLFAEAKVGLEQFKEKGEALPQEIGLNPHKMFIVEDSLGRLAQNAKRCQELIKDALQFAEAALGNECGFKKGQGFIKDIFLGIIGDPLCDAIRAIINAAAVFAGYSIKLLIRAAGLQ